MDEIWKDIVDFEGYYQVSNLGRVKSLNRIVINKGSCKTSKQCKAKLKGQLMKQRYSYNGYLRVKLMKDSKKHGFFVHGLVCQAFHGLRPLGKQVNHKDRIKTNNNSDNLEWLTMSENEQHIYDNLGSKKQRVILDLNTGVYYYSINDAAKYNNIKHRSLHSRLTGRVKNKSSLIFA